LIAVLLTIYVGPGANGSGTVEVMGLLNGINFPMSIQVDTLFVKIFGTLFAICGGLAVGKEGPLLHIGAIIGVMVCYMPVKSFRVLQNDVNKRQMIATGASCGVGCAFGAPIGGALFSYEISKPNTYWTFSMLWRVFFATSLGAFTLGILVSMKEGITVSGNSAGAIKFGSLTTVDNSLYDLFAAILIGAFCGLLGSFFIYIQTKMTKLRKLYINTNLKKILEAVFFAFITAAGFYLAVLLTKE